MESTREDTIAAVGGTGLAFFVALTLAVPQPPKLANLAIGAVVGALLIVIGFRAASRQRKVEVRDSKQRVKLAALSVLAGVVLGAALLAALVAIAKVEPALRARFVGRLHEPIWRPWALAFESSILEEVIFRLFAMSLAAWVVGRFLKRPGVVFALALIVSTLLFGLAHVPAWLSAAHASTALIATVLLLNGVGGLALGWIFWRFGLPYAILCHLAGDVIVQSFGPKLLGGG